MTYYHHEGLTDDTIEALTGMRVWKLNFEDNRYVIKRRGFSNLLEKWGFLPQRSILKKTMKYQKQESFIDYEINLVGKEDPIKFSHCYSLLGRFDPYEANGKFIHIPKEDSYGEWTSINSDQVLSVHRKTREETYERKQEYYVLEIKRN